MRISKIKQIDKIILAIVLLMIAIIPNLVYIIDVVTISPKIVHETYNTGYKLEMFNLCKSILLYITTPLIFILFMYKVFKLNYELKNIKVNIYTMILSIAIIISPIIAEYKYISIIGNTDRFEGALAWICYVFIFFVIYNINIEKKCFKLLYFALIPFLIINATIGLLDFYGIDILDYTFVHMLINSQGNASGRLMTTLYNPNFSSGLGGVIFVMGTIYFLFEEDIKHKALILVSVILSFIIVLTSLSLSGFMTLIILTPLFIILLWKIFNRENIILCILILLISNGGIFTTLYLHNDRIYDETFGFFERLININEEERNIWNSQEREKDLFSKMDSLSTGRVHIWKKTLELIKEKPILGYGFDTYPYNVDNSMSAHSFIDKPHNWYLTVWYGCGIIGVIGLLGIIITIVILVAKEYLKNSKNIAIYISGIGVIAYSFQGIFNDSFIGTSIVFWIFAGVCINNLSSNDLHKEIS